MEVLLSGLTGAVVTTFILIWYQYASEEIKNRKHAMITVIDWIDNIYAGLQVLCMYKEKKYKENQKTNTSREYKIINNEMRLLINSNKIPIEMACAFKEKNILQK